MGFIFRTAVTVSRKQPYIDWANGMDDDGPTLTLEDANREASIYLVTVSEPERAHDEVVDEWWDAIFEEELAAWAELETDWPATRTREKFDAWFDVALSGSIIDLAPEEPLTENDIDEATLAEALSTCAWCGLELGEKEGRVTGFEVQPPDRFADREGRALTLQVDREHLVTGIVPRGDSAARKAGYDLVFRICATRCEKGLRKAVARALRRLPTLP